MLKNNQTTKIPKYANYVFIDGQNIETGLRLQGLELDFQLLFNYLKTKYKVKKVYYCAKFSMHSSRKKFFKELKTIGYEMIFSSGMGNGRKDGSHKVKCRCRFDCAGDEGLFFTREIWVDSA